MKQYKNHRKSDDYGSTLCGRPSFGICAEGESVTCKNCLKVLEACGNVTTGKIEFLPVPEVPACPSVPSLVLIDPLSEILDVETSSRDIYSKTARHVLETQSGAARFIGKIPALAMAYGSTRRKSTAETRMKSWRRPL